MTEADFAAPRYHVSRAIGKLWWLPLVRGSLLILLGGYALFRPGMSMLLLTQLLGIYLVFEGVLAIMAALFTSAFAPRWAKEILKPAIEILAGFPSVVIGFFALVFLASALQNLF